jgi:hypothetical protein
MGLQRGPYYIRNVRRGICRGPWLWAGVGVFNREIGFSNPPPHGCPTRETAPRNVLAKYTEPEFLQKQTKGTKSEQFLTTDEHGLTVWGGGGPVFYHGTTNRRILPGDNGANGGERLNRELREKSRNQTGRNA